MGSATIEIFARLQRWQRRLTMIMSSATIEIFARLQQGAELTLFKAGSATIEIFARLYRRVIFILKQKSKTSLANLYYDCLHAI